MAAQRPVQQGKWVGGLFDCGSFSSFCGACCCYPCFWSRTQHRRKTFPRDPNETGFSWFNGDCAIMGVVGYFLGVPCILAMLKRGEHRDDYGIPGSTFGDFCTTCCCGPCAATQEDLDVKTRAEQARLVDHNGAPNQAYVKPEGAMNYHSHA